MTAHRAAHAIATLCRVLAVSPSGYYAWRTRARSPRASDDEGLIAEICAIHTHSRGTYGAPRIQAELAARGRRVSRKRIARLMRRAGVRGVSRRKWVTTSDQPRRPAPDLVQRAFTAPGPNQLWVADITYVGTWSGFLYLAVVLDAWSRRIVGWAMETHLRTDLVLAALEMAVRQRQPRHVIHHSDQGCQYTVFPRNWRRVVGGIDTHKDLHMAAVVDRDDGRLLETKDFSTTRAGYRALLRWMRHHGALESVGIEGTGSYGAGIAFLERGGCDDT